MRHMRCSTSVVNIESSVVWKKAVMAHNYSAGTEENHVKLQISPSFRPGFKPGICRMFARSHIAVLSSSIP